MSVSIFSSGHEPETVPALLRARAAQSPDAVAYAYEEGGAWKTIVWSEFHRRVHVLASALRARGLERGDTVAILAPTGLGWELFHHAILAAGGTVTGLDPHDLPERLQWMADHAAIRMLVVQDDALLKKLNPARTERLAAVVTLNRSASDEMPASNRVAWQALETTTEVGDLPDVGPGDPATLIFTSGTTGQPKGILYRHEQVALAVRAIAHAYPDIGVGTRFVCWLPLSNLFQRIMNLAAMAIGGNAYLVANPLDIMRVLPVARPEVFIGVPRFYEKLHEGIAAEIARKPAWLRGLIAWALDTGSRVARDRRDGRRSSVVLLALHVLADRLVLRRLRSVMGGHVRFMVTGSAPTPVPLLEYFDALGMPLYEAYGLSENVVPMALNRPGSVRLGTVGMPLPENEVRLAEDGELLVRGKGVFQGYYKDGPRDLFTADGYYRTGDYAEVGTDGYLKLRGRKSEIIKTSTGRRISPIEVEEALHSLPGVDRVMVVGNGRKCLAAIITFRQVSSASGRPEEDPGFRQSLADLVQKLAAHHRPGGFLLSDASFSIEAGDLTPNLKLRRSTIEDRLASALEELYRRIEAAPAGAPSPVLRLSRPSGDMPHAVHDGLA